MFQERGELVTYVFDLLHSGFNVTAIKGTLGFWTRIEKLRALSSIIMVFGFETEDSFKLVLQVVYTFSLKHTLQTACLQGLGGGDNRNTGKRNLDKLRGGAGAPSAWVCRRSILGCLISNMFSQYSKACVFMPVVNIWTSDVIYGTMSTTKFKGFAFGL